MQQQFHQHLQENFPFLASKKIMLAISGGIDSVVLAHLLKREDLDLHFAHCNFQLRGSESDRDEFFVADLAKQMEVPLHIKRFDTLNNVKEGRSIQLVARELRYDWFFELLNQEGYDYLVTAHHLHDDMETFFINLLRGTGLKGLVGIPEQTDRMIRPLLPFTLNTIEQFAKQEKITWREDHSNASDDYLRNRIRHHLIPLLERENTNFASNFLLTSNNLKDSMHLLETYQQQLTEEITHQKGEDIYFALSKIKKHPHPKALLYQLLHPYGFTAWPDIHALLDAQSGKQICSSAYRLIRGREYLVLTKNSDYSHKEMTIDGEGEIIFPEGRLICEKVIKVTNLHKDIAYLAADRLVYPLTLRRWRAGDRFQPFGMKGRKKLSDFLKDEKLNLLQKERTWVVVSEGRIIWVVGQRIDHRYRVRKETNEILKMEWVR